MMLDFDRVTLGNVIEIAVIGGGWIVTIVKIDGRLKGVERDLKDVISLIKWRERMEERIITLRRDLDELRRGRGFIRSDVNGEYDSVGKVDG
jgi:hypothetical protein